MATVSVIIPCYQGEAYLPRAIRSLHAQHFTNWEAVIISDDGMDYRPLMQASGLDDGRLIYATTGKTGSGAANARNAGMDAATAPFIANLDMDDEFAPSYLERMLPYAREYGCALSHYAYIDDATGQPIDISRGPKVRTGIMGLQSLPIAIYQYTHVSVVFDRARLPIRSTTATPVSEDTLFLFEAYEHIEAIYTCGDPLYIYYKRAGSITNNPQTISYYMQSKLTLLDMIRSKQILTRNPAVAAVAQWYFEQSVAAEEDYVEALKTDPNTDFVRVMLKRLGMRDT